MRRRRHRLRLQQRAALDHGRFHTAAGTANHSPGRAVCHLARRFPWRHRVPDPGYRQLRSSHHQRRPRRHELVARARHRRRPNLFLPDARVRSYHHSGGRGLIRTTFTATPARGRVVAAKGLIVGTVAFMPSVVVMAVTVTLGQHLLRIRGNCVFPAPLSPRCASLSVAAPSWLWRDQRHPAVHHPAPRRRGDYGRYRCLPAAVHPRLRRERRDRRMVASCR
jgi:hypothetical protein